MGEAFEDRYAVVARDLLGTVPDSASMDEEHLARAERHFGVILPESLRGYYLTIGNLGILNDAHNQLLPPREWFLDDGKLVFMVENQAVVYWGVDATLSPDDDPPVFQGINRRPDEEIDWHLECPRCSVFLSVMLIWQAVMGGLEWCGMSEDTAGHSVVDYLESKWRRVGSDNETLAYRREGLAACLLTDCGQLYIAGRTQVLFEEVASELRLIGIAVDQL